MDLHTEGDSKIYYQITARGQLKRISGFHTIRSKKIYSTSPTEEEIEDFKQLCSDYEKYTGKTSLNDLEYSTIKITINELELER